MYSASLAARHAELVAARERNAAKLRELRAALAQAERDDYAFAAVVGELERLLAQMPPGPKRRGRAKAPRTGLTPP